VPEIDKEVDLPQLSFITRGWLNWASSPSDLVGREVVLYGQVTRPSPRTASPVSSSDDREGYS